jgi:tRNA(Met) C34 N-acetyltransferase TmcA
MKQINTTAELKEAILELEARRTVEAALLRDQFNQAYESIKPINLIKSAFSEVAASQEIKANVVTTSLGLAAGFLVKKVFQGFSNNPIRRAIGTVIMFGITNVITKHPEKIKSVGSGIFNMLKSKPNEKLNGIGSIKVEQGK